MDLIRTPQPLLLPQFALVIDSMIARVNEHRDRMLQSPEPEQRAVAEALYRESRAALAALYLFSLGR